MRSVALAALWAMAMAAASPAFGDPRADKARADKLFDDGRKYLASKEYALACTAFEQSQEADPAIGTQLNIALCYEEWGHVAAAYRAYIEADRVATAKKDDRAKGAKKKIEQLGPEVPHLALVYPADADPAAIVLLDGKEIARDKIAGDLLVEIGSHTLEGRVPGKPPRVTTFDLASGQHARIVIDLPKPEAVVIAPPPPPPPPPPARNHGRLYGGIGLAGAGAVGLGVSIVVGLGARSDYGGAVCPMLQCATEADYKKTQDARSRANQMTFVGGGGLALAAVGVYLIATSGGKHADDTRTAVAPMVGPGVLGLAIGGRL